MSTSRDLLKFVAPEFEDLDDAALDMALSLAANRISAVAFGKIYPQAAAYMAAHILATSRGDAASAGVAGAITSVKTGDLAIGATALATGSAGDSALASTPYGARFLELRDTVPTSPYRRQR